MTPVGPINLDANATYGVLPEVVAGLEEALQGLNPSSIHTGGQRARAQLELARDRIAALLRPRRGDRIVFTSGATEANTTAIYSPFLIPGSAPTPMGEESSPEWITTAYEHHSVLEPLMRLESRGARGLVLTPPRGALTGAELEPHLSAATKLVAVMFANNETGHISPLNELARVVRRVAPECRIHTDAVQMLGKVNAPLADLDIDTASISAHKIGGLTGVGALIIRAGTPFEPLLVGGAQETRYRAGTENVPGIVAFGIAAAAVRRDLDARISKMAADRRRLEVLLAELTPGARFNHPQSAGLPNTISLTAPGIRADDVVVALDLKGIYVSSGAACASGKPEPSHVLRALGLSNDDARATLRISLRADHSADELTRAAYAISEAIARGRGV